VHFLTECEWEFVPQCQIDFSQQPFLLLPTTYLGLSGN